jgi:hypothetical protein
LPLRQQQQPALKRKRSPDRPVCQYQTCPRPANSDGYCSDHQTEDSQDWLYDKDKHDLGKSDLESNPEMETDMQSPEEQVETETEDNVINKA